MSIPEIRQGEVNFRRLLKRLDENFERSGLLQSSYVIGEMDYFPLASLKSEVSYAIHMLENMRSETFGNPSAPEILTKLSGMEALMQDTLQRLEDIPTKHAPLLASIRPPRLNHAIRTTDIQSEKPSQNTELLPDEFLALQPPTTTTNIQPSETNNLPSFNTLEVSNSPKQANKYPEFLTTSLQTQEELSLQLSQMAAQLKRNALHFADSLDKDKNVIESAQEKLESNLGGMKGERTRLRDHSGKSSHTTWMVVGSLLTVVLAWVFMFFIIRLT